MPHDSVAYRGGFADPVYQSQCVFKTIMDCMSRPGTIGRLDPVATPPAPLGAAAGAIALTLCDHDTPIHMSGRLIEAGVQSWLAFQAGALITDVRDEASFAFIEKGASLPSLSTFAMGSQEYPDRSATLVYEVSSLTSGRPLTLSGPGIDGETTLAPEGLPAQFERAWLDNAAQYPRGIDLILTCGNDIVCLPRTTRIQSREI
ncbi:phosphonate C-P lyase system protein PhnH [Rhizobium alvei]|uniref:Phosphonate C-P lyase system protein PhnH n=1 Tax=Rhizobium alvei TaxID=1132659 RepID=A0ABT8YPY0_9HYPH|nr:phosphonate C-P lyase system protein PhnH [Rhizobium alvei]MDO6965757.1 phosphonate C-P lyase system protein PhnH [Rhizobium alvei]